MLMVDRNERWRSQTFSSVGRDSHFMGSHE
jgi:hypothetical protein